MDGFLQKIIMYIISVLLLFIYPIYTAYERKDDMSHMIVSKATHVLVDNVRNKGYISLNMYNDYNDIINITGNFYDVKVEVKSKRYDPIVNIYECVKSTNGNNEIKLKYEIPREKYTGEYEKEKKYIDLHDGKYKSTLDRIIRTDGNTAPLEGVDYIKSVANTAKVQYEIYTEKQIIATMLSQKMVPTKPEETIQEKIFRLNANNKKFLINKGDSFVMKVKNENITASTMFYSIFTARNSDALNPKIYIHYGGVVRNEINNIIIPTADVK